MLVIESFPHHNQRYENDERQAAITVLLLDGFLVLLSLLVAVLVFSGLGA